MDLRRTYGLHSKSKLRTSVTGSTPDRTPDTPFPSSLPRFALPSATFHCPQETPLFCQFLAYSWSVFLLLLHGSGHTAHYADWSHTSLPILSHYACFPQNCHSLFRSSDLIVYGWTQWAPSFWLIGAGLVLQKTGWKATSVAILMEATSETIPEPQRGSESWIPLLRAKEKKRRNKESLKGSRKRSHMWNTLLSVSCCFCIWKQNFWQSSV